VLPEVADAAVGIVVNSDRSNPTAKHASNSPLLFAMFMFVKRMRK
jgi:hypothetical protein